jgi:PAS domain S-box-containing protein
VSASDSEEKRLRSAALKNVEEVLKARQRAERDLVAANEALERKTRELQQQRQWYEVTLASIGDAVITTDVHSRVTFLNPVAEAMTGWPRREAQGQPLLNVFRMVNEETRQPAENPVARVLADGDVVGLADHTALIARDGSERSIEESAAPIRDASGEVVGVVMVFHDVTSSRRAERALRTSEERLRAMFSQAAIGIGVANLDGTFHEANPRFCSMLGYPLDELKKRTFLQLTYADDREETAQQARQLLDGSIESYSVEKRYVRKSGGVFWSNTTVALMHHENGAPSQFIGIVEDITQRKEADAMRNRLSAVIESSDDAIITETLDGIITSWNPGAQRVFGYSAEEVLGMPITLLFPTDQADEEPVILERLRRGERLDHYTRARRRKDGALIDVSVSASPIKDYAGRTIGASKIARDITAQKRAEEALLEQNRVLQREIASRERAEAALREIDERKDLFLATLAHELRNPLAPIRQAALLSDTPGATEAQKRWSHEVISRQVHHMSLLLDDLLDISRVTRGTLELRMEMTDLAAAVEAAVETARPAVDAKRHKLTVQLPAERVLFAADPLRLAQVLSNLLTNAAKYTDPGGSIALRASASEDAVTIAVADTGIGLEPNALSRVFTMFSQIKTTQDRSEGGLGIGLALSKGLLDLHGGSIEARSAGAGRGSEFIVRLPRRTITAEKRVDQRAPSGHPVNGRRVLIADDNRDAADSLAMLLRLEGHEVKVVHDGKQALAGFHDLNPEVALLDIGMPELDGYEVARRVRQGTLGRAVTLVAVTGWGQESDKARALAAGFNHHFTKPVEPERILALLRTDNLSC